MVDLIIKDEKRKALFLEIFETDIIPVKQAIPVKVNIIAFNKLRKVYFLAFEMLNKKQQENLLNYIAEKNKTSKEEVREEINEIGFPIIAKGTAIKIELSQIS